MGYYLRPRRGTQSKANSTLSGTGKLKSGEVFFEVPTAGVGKGQGRLMMGDGSTNYGSLKAFLAFDMNNVQTFSDVTASNSTNVNSILASIKPTSTLANNLNRIKLALLNIYSSMIANTSNCTTVATISATTETQYSSSINMFYSRFIYARLYTNGSSGLVYDSMLIPTLAFRSNVGSFKLFYNSSHYGEFKYVSSIALKGKVYSSSDRIEVSIVDKIN